jgi:UDP-N-acetylmuramoyl-L-alanyl-D-glutamate--2,6-diaminopimelate ligase
MQLRELLAEIPTLGTQGSLEREIAGLSYDSRRVTPGMVFVALPGLNADGHEFIMNAIERGAAAVICEQNGFVSPRTTKIKVADAREALAKAAASFYQHPSSKLKVVGVTGTNGKTTVAFMIKEILQAASIRAGLIGTIRYEIGDRILTARRTTPESLELHEMMAQMVRAECRACVMEVSSHALEQKRVNGIEFDVAIFTNLTQDHLDYHGTMEAYFQAKQKLFTGLHQSAKPGAAIINIDDAYGERLAHEVHPEIMLTYGLDEAAKIRASQIQLGRDSTRMLVETPAQSFPCCIPLIGRHNIYNALAAIGAGLALNVDVAAIQTGLSGMPKVPGRLESIAMGQPFGVLIDYAHTDDALRNVLTTVREITSGRLILVFGCGGNRDVGKRPRMGAIAARLADLTIITSDNPRKEIAATIALQIEEGYRSIRADGSRIEEDRSRAIDDAVRAAKPGDTVLIAGKGHETYQEFENTVVPFDDRVRARESLEALGYRGNNQTPEIN